MFTGKAGATEANGTPSVAQMIQNEMITRRYICDAGLVRDFGFLIQFGESVLENHKSQFVRERVRAQRLEKI